MNIGKRALILFVVGAILGTVGDLFHVLSGTLGYPPTVGPFMPGGFQPYWVPLLFGGAVVTIGFSHSALDRALGTAPPRAGHLSNARILAGIVLTLVTWAASGFLPLSTGGLKDATIAALGFATWGYLDRTWQGLVLGLLTGAAGVFVEASFVRGGAFFYYPEASNLFGVASWLPWLYVAASVGVGNLDRRLSLNGQGQ